MKRVMRHPYVESRADILGGSPAIRGTRTPVRAVAQLWKFGLPPEEIVDHLPHLNLAQVFDALSYYQDCRKRIDGEIRREWPARFAKRSRTAA